MTIKLAYVANTDWPGTSPGLPFAMFSTRGFWQAGADCVLLLHGRTSASVAVVRQALFTWPAEFPIWPLRAPRLGGSKFLFYWRAFLTLLHSDRTVLITRNLNFLPWAMALRRLKGLRVYFEAHNFWADPTRHQTVLRAPQHRHVRLERRWLPHVDGIISISEPLTQLYRRYYPDVPTLTAWPGAPVVQPIERQQFSYTLGYTGSLHERHYPLSLVMQALVRLRQPAVRLLCIGAANSQEIARMQQQAARFGLQERVEVYPWLSGARLAQVTARMDAGISVLADAFLPRLVCPTKVFAYLAAGIPVVATRFDGVAGVLRHGTHGFLVDNTPAAWAEGIGSLYADFARYQHMARHCYVLATVMSWQQRAQHILHAMASGVLSGQVTVARQGHAGDEGPLDNKD